MEAQEVGFEKFVTSCRPQLTRRSSGLIDGEPNPHSSAFRATASEQAKGTEHEQA
jgi:hypothetical protein